MNDFKVLTEREHLRQRISMYLGADTPTEYSGIINFQYQTKTIIPALLKGIEEIFQNSVDEYIRTDGKFANKIDVSIKEDGLNGWKVEVSDNGRGIPAVKHGDKYQAEIAWTQPRAGSNFSDDANRITIGVNGVGSFGTNCTSTKFVGVSSDGETEVTVTSLNGCETTKVSTKKSSKKGTTVTFWPDLEFFNASSISQDHIDVVEDALTNIALCYPGIAIRLNGKRLHIRNNRQLAKSFHEDAIVFNSNNDKMVVVIAPSGDDEEFRHLSFVNGISIRNGGNHVDFITNSIIHELIPVIKRRHKIDVLPNQIRQHLIVACWIHGFPNPRFDSQSKERITNTPGELRPHIEFDAAKVARQLLNTESIIGPAIEAILHRKELADRRAAAAAMRKTRKKKIADHLQATHKDPMERTLFITEGRSAIGSLITVRDPKIHGGYALRGKVMNTSDMKEVDIIKNKELAELISILNLDLSKESIDDLEYGSVKILTDMDPDGTSIFCLLLNFFSRWPKLFEEGRIQRFESPLYIARHKGKKTEYFYTHSEYTAARANLKGFEIEYIKGLGSLTDEDYKYAIDNPRYTVVTLDSMEKLEMAFGKDSNARKEWMLQ